MKLNVWFYILGVVLLLSGCAIEQPHQDQNNLYIMYQSYLAALPTSTDEELLKKYWSQDTIAEGMAALTDDSEKNKRKKKAMIFSIRFASEMKNALSTEQTIQDNTACLLVVGIGTDNKRVAFNIPYVRENNAWKMAPVLLTYIEDGQPTPKTPNCDIKSLLNLTPINN